MILTPDNIRAAVVRHETIFFDADLQPIVPQPGQWFCEYDIELAEEGNEILRDGAIVEFVETEVASYSDGEQIVRHWVTNEYSDDWREPRGWALIRQA